MASNEQSVPDNIAVGIRKTAMDLFEDDSEMQELTIEEETDAYLKLQSLEVPGVDVSLLKEMKSVVEEEHPWDFCEQLEYVWKRARGHVYVQETRRRIEPIKDLLVSMERIIGNECYNANIQNYGPYGEWEGEGRSFRYPVTFVRNESDDKTKDISSDIDAEILMTGRYKFGANQLNIFVALEKILDFLKEEHGVRLDQISGGAD